jgi:hypothetical protein
MHEKLRDESHTRKYAFDWSNLTGSQQCAATLFYLQSAALVSRYILASVDMK